jgi:hypothetical protein
MMAEDGRATPKDMEKADKQSIVLAMIVTRCDDCAGEAFKLHCLPFYLFFPFLFY